MLTKNAQIYRLPAPWDMTAEQLGDALKKGVFQPCGAQDTEQSGWVAPCESSPDVLVHAVIGRWLICLQTETKSIPASLIKQEAKKLAEEIAQQQGYEPGRKQMKEISETVREKLLPQAFPRSRRLYCWIDPTAGWLVIDSPSQSKAEAVLEGLRKTLDAIPVMPVRTNVSPATAMTDWLLSSEDVPNFTVDQDCELRSPSEDRATVRYTRQTLEKDEIRGHIEAGKVPVKLAMTHKDRLSFVLTEKGELRRIQLLDVVKETVGGHGEDAQALFDSEFAISTAEILELLSSLIEALGGEKIEAEPERLAA